MARPARRRSAGRLIAWSIAGLLMAAPCPAQPQQAFEDVVRNLRNPDAKARMSAVQRLRESRHVEAAVPVAAVITDPVEAIQLEAIAAELSFFLVDEVPARRRAGLLVEVRSKGQAQPAFELGPLVTWSRSAPPEVIDGLLKAVDDEDSRVRTEAIYALGVIGRPPLTNEAADRLITALDHYDPVIRSAAARVIGRLEVGRAGDALIGAINDSTLAVRYAAMRGLGDLREVRAIQALTDQLSFYRTGEGAWSALDGLARIGHASSAPLFKARLADKDPYFRRVAAEGLARLGDQSESAAIQAAAAKDASLMVRAAMTFALAKADPGAVAQLVEFFASDKIALQVQGYLLELGPASRPGVSAALKHPNANVRAGAADVIGTVGTAESVALLEPLTKDRDRAVARSASAAIERIKQRR